VGATTTWFLLATINPTGYPQVVEEHTGASPGTISRRYSYGLDLISQTTGSTTRFFGTDGLGSTRFLLSDTGSLVEHYGYDAYGTIIVSNTTPSTVYLFAGEQWDADLGLYYNRARYMNVGLGWFWSYDTFDGSNQDPLSLHKYLYVQANPVNRLDPSGYLSGTAAETEGAVGIGLTVQTLELIGIQALRQGLARGVSGVILRAGAAIITAAVLVPVGVGVVVSLKELEDDSDKKEKLLYRAMKDENGSPRVGDGTDARSLTVRPSPPYPFDKADVIVVGGVVSPGQGLSVAPGNAMNLPAFRRPPSLGGTGKDPVWVLYGEVLRLSPELSYWKDSPTHGLIEPAFPMPLNEFQRALGETQEFWSKFAPGN
jgi:RHS repeat-associated protein